MTVAAQGGFVIAEDAVLGQPTPCAAVPAGTWTLDLTADATASRGAVAAVAAVAGSVYTVAVVDGRNGALAVLPVTDAAGTDEPAAPVGGVQTGAGGAATSFVGAEPGAGPSPSQVAALVLAGAAALAGGVLLRRRARP